MRTTVLAESPGTADPPGSRGPERPQRILLAAMALELGGAETHVVSLARALRRRGLEVEVASSGGRLAGRLEESGIPHHFLPLASRRPWQLGHAVRGLRGLVLRRGIELVHAHARIPAWVADRALAGSGVPLLTTYHGLYNDGWFWRRVTRWGDLAIAVSEDVRDHLVRRLGADPARVVVVPNGIDLDEYAFSPSEEAPPELDLPAGAPVVLHVSRLSEFTETALALAAAAPALADRLPGARILVAGTGSRLEQVRQAAGEANRRAGQNVMQVLGARWDVPALLGRAWVAVGVGRSALEAMAAARPVIISGNGGYGGILSEERLADFEAHNFTARGFGRPVEAADLLPDLVRLLGDEALRGRLGAMGRETVHDRYSIERTAAQVEELYRRLFAGSAGRRPLPGKGGAARP
ncbi:MAG: glycosyltransferase family 4 protein [Bacillota bacterium]|nr:glycosyltransferase family 4 protein [Bacillota bacterium]